MPPKSFLSEMQNVVQRRRGLESSPPSGPTVANGGQPSNLQSATLADQLRSCLEERRKSKEEEHQPSQQPQHLPMQPQQQQPLPPQQAVAVSSGSAAFVPESIAADIQEAVKLANDTSKFPCLIARIDNNASVKCSGKHTNSQSDFELCFIKAVRDQRC